MAAIRQLKKEIDNQVFEVVSDSLLFLSMNPEQDVEEVTEIVHEAVKLRNDLIGRIYHPEDKGNAKAIRDHFRSVKNDLAEGIDLLCQKLSKLSSENKKSKQK